MASLGAATPWAGHELSSQLNSAFLAARNARSANRRLMARRRLRLAALGPQVTLLELQQATHVVASVLEAASNELLVAHTWGQHALQHAGAPFLADLAAALAPACFDDACQREKDTFLIASLVVPVIVLLVAVAYLLRPPPQSSIDDGTIFEDGSTGTIFEAPEGTAPERDRRGELAFRAISYTPWPVEEGAEGERLRIEVGPVGQRQPRTFVFTKVLPQPSQLVVTTLERPLGIVFEEDKRRKRVVVAGFTPGGNAEQKAKNARLNPSLAASAALEGDVLRACTATNIVYQPAALAFGMQRPVRSIVVYGADGQGWPQVIAALQRGLLADGPVTLVLERRISPESANMLGVAGTTES